MRCLNPRFSGCCLAPSPQDPSWIQRVPPVPLSSGFSTGGTVAEPNRDSLSWIRAHHECGCTGHDHLEDESAEHYELRRQQSPDFVQKLCNLQSCLAGIPSTAGASDVPVWVDDWLLVPSFQLFLFFQLRTPWRNWSLPTAAGERFVVMTGASNPSCQIQEVSILVTTELSVAQHGLIRLPTAYCQRVLRQSLADLATG